MVREDAHERSSKLLPLDKLMTSVIYPAVAGNVLWSIISMGAGERPADPTVYWIRVGVLLLLAGYLIAICRQPIPATRHALYIPLDILVMVSLSGAAIATALPSPVVAWLPGAALISTFVLAGIGHAAGIWAEPLAGRSKLPIIISEWGGALVIAAISWKCDSVVVMDAVNFLILAIVLGCYWKLRLANG